jgi:hypothetical protein
LTEAQCTAAAVEACKEGGNAITEPDASCPGGGPETNCTNGLDDDGDGAIDCADSDCASDPACQGPTTETNCTNLLDDDGDGAIDCADSDCASDPACQQATETNCSNGLDDDGDGLIDCDDPDCTKNRSGGGDDTNPGGHGNDQGSCNPAGMK